MTHLRIGVPPFTVIQKIDFCESHHPNPTKCMRQRAFHRDHDARSQIIIAFCNEQLEFSQFFETSRSNQPISTADLDVSDQKKISFFERQKMKFQKNTHSNAHPKF